MSTDTEMSTSPVLLERNGEIAIIRLHRPDRLNAFTDEMCEHLIDAFDRTDADDSVRAVVLTGTGRAFCAGADLAAGGETFVLGDDPDTGGAPADQGGRVSLRMRRSDKPVIAAINGPAAGVGVTMALPAVQTCSGIPGPNLTRPSRPFRHSGRRSCGDAQPVGARPVRLVITARPAGYMVDGVGLRRRRR